MRKYLFHLKGRHYRYETLQIWGDGESLTAEPQFPEVSSSWQRRAPGETAQSSHLDDEGRGRGKCSLCCSSSLQLHTSIFIMTGKAGGGGWQERPSCWYLGPTWPGRSLKVKQFSSHRRHYIFMFPVNKTQRMKIFVVRSRSPGRHPHQHQQLPLPPPQSEGDLLSRHLQQNKQ